MKTPVLALSAAAIAVVAACAVVPARDAARLSQLPPPPFTADNPFSPAKLELGRQLFFDPRLSGSGTMSCESCHYRHLGWTDGQPLSRRDDGTMNTRHTPTIYNMAYLKQWYWDGRAKTLQGQIEAAWRAQIGADPDKVAARLAQVPGYVEAFRAAFGEGERPTPRNIVLALEIFFRSLVSGDSPWDRHERGIPNQVSQDAIEGFQLFMGKGRCAVCHTPPAYTNGDFYNIGLEAKYKTKDPGRFNVTKNPADFGAFKVPTLRSVGISAPYFHDGSVAQLADAVRYMAGGGFDDPNKSPLLVDTGLTEREIQRIVAFLHTLTSDELLVRPRLP